MTDTSPNYTDLNNSLQISLDDMQKMHDIIEVAQRGSGITQAIPNAVKVLAQVKGEEETEAHANSLKNVQPLLVLLSPTAF